jgi:hypothetical protein
LLILNYETRNICLAGTCVDGLDLMDLSRRTKDHRSAKRNGHAFDRAVLVVGLLGKMPQHITCGSLEDANPLVIGR